MTVDDRPWAKRQNIFKETLRRGDPAVAMWVTIPWPPLLEMLGCCGLDAAFIDLEHTSFGLDRAELMITSAELAGVTPLVRMGSSLNVAEVGRVLDAGAQGIIFPLMDNAADAETARKALEYPPHGVRGWGGAHVRYAVWQGGSGVRVLRAPDPKDRGVYCAEYVEKSRADILSVFIIESVAGVENLEAILEAGQPDLIYFGWGDFSVDVEFDFDRCVEAATRVYDVCKARGVGMSIAPGQASTAEPYAGCFSIVGTDALVANGAFMSSIEAARASLTAHAG